MGSCAEQERCTTSKGDYAHCPFRITQILAADERPRQRDRAKNGRHEGLVQESPFKPQGAFKTRQSMNVLYFIEPHEAWLDLSRYNSFVLNGERHLVGDFVHVDSGSSNEWVARILEIRASDEYHVYARVYWMYSPHDLPCKTARNHGRAVERSQFYGHDEMIASNHMDIISVLSIVRAAAVQHSYGEDDDTRPRCLHWRQAFDYPTQKLSSINATHEHKNQALELAPSGSAVREEPQPVPEKQTSKQSRLDEEQPIPSVVGEAQVTRIVKGKPDTRRIHRRRRLRRRGRPHKNAVDRASMSAAHVNGGPVWQPTSKPSLVHFSAPFQHSLLVELQGILEIACYDYTKQAMPDMIRRKGWHCAESVELNHWTFEMRKFKLVTEWGSDDVAMAALLRSVASIRHTAVHRRRVGVAQIDKFFMDALSLLGFLGDEDGCGAVVALRQEATALLACGTNDRRAVPGDSLRKIATKRAHLQFTEKMSGIGA